MIVHVTEKLQVQISSVHTCRSFCYYRPQRSWAKVIFLQASVCPRGGGVSASVHTGIPTRPGADTTPPDPTPPDQTPTRHPPGPGTPPPCPPPDQTRHTIPPGPDPPQEQTPPASRLRHTVYERAVRILLECILVTYAFSLPVNIENIYLWFIFESFIQMVTFIMQSMHL